MPTCHPTTGSCWHGQHWRQYARPGKSGITFDHILSRLQAELQKGSETGAELHSLTGAMNDIHETFGGNLVRTIILLFHATQSN